MKKIAKYILTTLSILIFTLSIYIVIFGTIARKNNSLVYFFGYSYANVPTDSMEGNREGSIEKGSYIFVKKKKYENIVIDEDVVVFYDEAQNRLIVHRVIGIDQDGYITQGDKPGAPIDSSRVTKENYRAVVLSSFKIFNLGENVSAYQLQILGVLIIILFVFFIYQVINFTKLVFENKKTKSNQEKIDLLKEEIRKELEEELGDQDEKH